MRKVLIILAVSSLFGLSACTDNGTVMVHAKSDNSSAKQDDGKTGEDDGKTGEDDGKTGEDDGKTGEDDGKTGEDDGKTGEDDGKTGEDDGKTGEDEKCQDACSEGEPVCEGTQQVKSCEDKNGDSCLEWVYETCPSGQICQGGKCVDSTEPCTSECDEGKECADGTSYKECRDMGDGCKKWVVTPCSEGTECKGGSCAPKGAECKNECEGGTSCNGTSILQTCRDDNKDGCLEWIPSNCPEGTECREGKCEVLVPPCSDTCDTPTACDGKKLKECKDTDNDGCKEWTPSKDCPSGEECQGGACVKPAPTCTNKCATSGALQCSGNDLQECKDSDGDKCLEWVKKETCKFKCESNKCVDNPDGWLPQCTTSVCPTAINDLSKPYPGNTKNSKNNISEYTSCKSFNKSSVANESGPEEYYAVNIKEPGYLVAGVSCSGSVDVDVHILSELKGDKCLARGDVGAGAYISKPGVYYVSADTYSGSSKAGAYTLKITFIPDSSKCGMDTGSLARLGGCSTISMPVTAGTAAEAHLVTDHDRSLYGSSWWPSTKKDKVSEHKAHTDSLFGSGTSAGDDWCPAEGGHIGQGSAANQVPADAEAWYINMYWKSRPAKGTRFLVVDPVSGKTVVAAGGYETGPGSCDHMGGAVYEIHHYFGTGHNSTLTFGQLKSSSQNLKYGPIDCNN